MTATQLLYANEHIPDGYSQFHWNSFTGKSWAEKRQFRQEGTDTTGTEKQLNLCSHWLVGLWINHAASLWFTFSRVEQEYSTSQGRSED